MIPAALWLAIPLEEFLEGATASVWGQRLEVVGALLSLPALLVAIGVVVFCLTVFRGSTEELRTLIRVCIWCAGGAVLGAGLSLIGTFDVLGVGWSDVAAESRLWAASMRLVGASLIVVGLLAESRRLGVAGDPGQQTRWLPGPAAAIGLVGAMVAAFSFAFDGHSVSQGPRLAQVLLNPVHVLAGSTWLGGLVALVTLRRLRRRHGGQPLAALVVRFSTVATWALLVVAIAGVGLSLLIVDGLDEYFTTTWGRVLLAKVWLVLIAGAIGAYNRLALVPLLDRDPGDPVANARARTTVAVECVLLLAVAGLTVFLTRASIN
jgi:copper transport protein